VIHAAPLRTAHVALLVAATGCAAEDPSRTSHQGAGHAQPEAAHATAKPTPWWDDANTSWKPVSGAPSECSYRVAAEPAQAAPILDWRACPGVEGCRLFEPVGPPGTKLAVTGHVWRRASGYEVGLVLTHYPMGTSVLYDASGTATWAARSRVSECSPLGPFPGEHGTCLGYAHASSGKANYACGATTAPERLLDAPSVQPAQLGQFSGELLALWGTDGTATVQDGPGRTTSVLGAPLHVSQAPRAHGARAFVRGQNEAGDFAGYVWSRGAGFRPLLERSPKQVLDVNGDGTWLTWIEAGKKTSSGEAFPDAELWRSPFGTTSEGLTPTKVRNLENVPALVFSVSGRGYYALLKDYEGIDLYRVADGTHWKVKPPAGYVADYVLQWVDDEELAYTVRAVQRPIAIVRQRIDALGAGD
jgi:hypothetical protein